MCQVISPPAVSVKLPHKYHQEHYPVGLLACPACRHEMMFVRSYGKENEPRVYYALCDNERCDTGCEGPKSQPTSDQASGIREAVKGFNDQMLAYARDILNGGSGAI